jgi:ABC-type Na+ efflux pump permease subunit
VPEQTPERVGEIGTGKAVAILLGGLILVLLVSGLFAYLTLRNPAVF